MINRIKRRADSAAFLKSMFELRIVEFFVKSVFFD